MNSEYIPDMDTLIKYLAGQLSQAEQLEVKNALLYSEEVKEMKKDIDFFIEAEDITYADLLQNNSVGYENLDEVLYRYYERYPQTDDWSVEEGIDHKEILQQLQLDSNLESIYPQVYEAVSQNLASKVAIQGVAGCFHEIAAKSFLGNSLSFVNCDSFPKLMRELEGGNANYGIMAIENSVAGSIIANYELLRSSNFEIVGEVYMRIEHNLMALPGQELSDIREVHSHPMALLQCQKFFSEIHPDARMVEREDTASSAKWIRDTLQTGVAAIASKEAARIYGLDIIAKGIETNKRNFTRFLVLLEKSRAEHYPRVRNKASVCFEVSHHIGNLADILMVLKSYDLNLTKIQSTPILGREWEYFIHLDVEFNEYDLYRTAFQAISQLVQNQKILGEYERGSRYNKESYDDGLNIRDHLITPGTL